MRKRIDELIHQEPANFRGYFWRGFLEIQDRNHYDAVRFLRRAEALDANPYVLKTLAFAYYFLGQYQLFTLTMEKVIQKQPADFAPYYYLGRYYSSSDAPPPPNFARAAEYFQEALERNPTQHAIHYHLGYCYEAQRNLEDAQREYRRSIELADNVNQHFALPRQGMARLLLLKNRPAEALKFATQAVDLAPNDAASRTILAQVYTALGQTARAVPEWERGAALDPTNSTPWFRLYRAYLELGDKAKASQAFAKYQKLVSLYDSG